jgi:serine acetyltransferase
MSAELIVGNGLKTDDGVTLGYRPSRSATTVPTLGAGAGLQSGMVIYAASQIGSHLETGHHVVIREGARKVVAYGKPAAPGCHVKELRASRPARARPTRPVWRRHYNC